MQVNILQILKYLKLLTKTYIVTTTTTTKLKIHMLLFPLEDPSAKTNYGTKYQLFC